MDIIVFDQNELENAVKNDITSIGLCDNTFILPSIGSITYTAIGNVDAEINVTEENFYKLNIICIGFTPAFSQINIPMAIESPLLPSSSYASSYATSYLLSSYFITSYSYRYEYEFAASTSYITSYTTSYTTSYITSYASSYNTSFLSLLPSFKEPSQNEYAETCIMVNGYGINLI